MNDLEHGAQAPKPFHSLDGAEVNPVRSGAAAEYEQGELPSLLDLGKGLPSHRISRLDDLSAGKIGSAFLIGGEDTVHHPTQESIGKSGTQVLFHNGAANPADFSREQKGAGGIASQADDAIRPKTADDPKRTEKA